MGYTGNTQSNHNIKTEATKEATETGDNHYHEKMEQA